MKSLKYGDTYLYFDDEKSIKLYDKIKNTCYNIIKVMKDDQRSYVALIEIDGKNYVYKEPREKNRRKWQRFLSIFRGSESKREYQNIKNILKAGFNAATPYLAVEEKRGAMVVNSYLLYSYIEGRDGRGEDMEAIAQELREIHKKGYLHGDSHMANFLVGDGKIYLIDTKLMKNKYGRFGEIFEFIYLEESYGHPIEYDKESFYYKMAMVLKRYLLGLGELKKRLRGKK